MSKLIDGKQIAKKRLERLKEKITLQSKKPIMAFILVGDHAPSKTYVRMKKKACEATGIISNVFELPENVSEKELLAEIEKLNKDLSVDGILVQLPLPKQISVERVINTIDPNKDVDGFHPINLGKLLIGCPLFVPCTPQGIKNLLLEENIQVEGKHVVVVGRSQIVGKPLACLLMQKDTGANATVTIAHSKTKNLKEITSSADILIAAMGMPQFITEDMVKKGAIVIDVGINRIDDKIVGDVLFENVLPKVSKITPVPGGVGPMTIISLLENTYQSHLIRNA